MEHPVVVLFVENREYSTQNRGSPEFDREYVVFHRVRARAVAQ